MAASMAEWSKALGLRPTGHTSPHGFKSRWMQDCLFAVQNNFLRENPKALNGQSNTVMDSRMTLRRRFTESEEGRLQRRRGIGIFNSVGGGRHFY
jgi:hypothetical protein